MLHLDSLEEILRARKGNRHALAETGEGKKSTLAVRCRLLGVSPLCMYFICLALLIEHF